MKSLIFVPMELMTTEAGIWIYGTMPLGENMGPKRKSPETLLKALHKALTSGEMIVDL